MSNQNNTGFVLYIFKSCLKAQEEMASTSVLQSYEMVQADCPFAERISSVTYKKSRTDCTAVQYGL